MRTQDEWTELHAETNTEAAPAVKLADLIEVTATPGGDYSLRIDGEELPFYVSEVGVAVKRINHSELPGATFTVLAKRVTVDHSVRTPQVDD